MPLFLLLLALAMLAVWPSDVAGQYFDDRDLFMSYLANPKDLGDADWYLNRWPAVDEPLIDVGAEDIPGLNPNVRMRSDGCIIDLSESTLWLDLNYCSQRTATLGWFDLIFAEAVRAVGFTIYTVFDAQPDGFGPWDPSRPLPETGVVEGFVGYIADGRSITRGFSYNKAWNNDGCCVIVRDFVFSYDVVPEPLSVILLGSGLLGIGGVALYRRRREA